MRYEVRTGIVRMKICGVSFLSPTRKAAKDCSLIMPLKFFVGIIWTLLSEGKTIDEVYEVFQKLLGSSRNNLTEEQITEIVDKNLKELVDNGYVIRAED